MVLVEISKPKTVNETRWENALKRFRSCFLRKEDEKDHKLEMNNLNLRHELLFALLQVQATTCDLKASQPDEARREVVHQRFCSSTTALIKVEVRYTKKSHVRSDTLN